MVLILDGGGYLGNEEGGMFTGPVDVSGVNRGIGNYDLRISELFLEGQRVELATTGDLTAIGTIEEINQKDNFVKIDGITYLIGALRNSKIGKYMEKNCLEVDR